MKAKSILTITFILLGSLAFANEKNDNKFVVIASQKAGVYKAIFEDVAVNATITIFDKAGKLVYSKNIKTKNGFILPMNFNGLHSGEYTIEVKNGVNKWIQTINYSS